MNDFDDLSDEGVEFWSRTLAGVLKLAGVDAAEHDSKYLREYIAGDYDLEALECSGDSPEALRAYLHVLRFLRRYVDIDRLHHNSDLSDHFSDDWRTSGAFRLCAQCEIRADQSDEYLRGVLDAYQMLFYCSLMEAYQV